MIYSESPRRQQITKHVGWGHWFALANILMAIAISLVYLFSTPIADTPISFIYLITTWLGHTSFIIFLGFVILVLPLCYQIQNMRVLRATSSVIAASSLALLAFDALLYNKTGFHISFSSAELLRSETRGQIGAFGWLQWFYLILLFIIWLIFQLVIANAIYKRFDRLRKYKIAPYIIVSFVLCFVTSHAIHVWADARLYTPVLKQDNMFPLSYPATAKTLMARYGLLDLENRQQLEELQYNSDNNRFNYPPQPVYCSVDKTKKVIVLAVVEATTNDVFAGLKANNYHLNTQNDDVSLVRQLHYGIPNNLLSMTQNPSVVAELMKAFEVPYQSYIASQEDEQAFAELNKQMAEFKNGLFLASVTMTQLDKIDFNILANNARVMLIHKNQTRGHYQLHTNFDMPHIISSNEDIAPTILQYFECSAQISRYSTGQALQTPTREWIVSTQDQNLVVLRYPLKTIVGTDGSHEVINLENQTKVLKDIDTNLLSRSIKHLKDFSEQ